MKNTTYISNKELIIISVLTFFTALAYSSNFFIGMVRQTMEYPFVGLISMSKWDLSVYYSMIDQAKHGAWFVQNLFTSEGGSIGLLHPLWIVLGRLANLVQVSAMEIFHWSRFVGSIIFLYGLYYLSLLFITKKWYRVLFIAASGWLGGFGYLLLINQEPYVWLSPYALKVMAVDVWYSDGFTFLALNHSPLLLVAQLLLIAAWFLLVYKKTYARWIVMVLVLLLGFIHPYDIPIFWTVALSWAALLWFCNKPEFRPAIRNLLPSIISTLVVAGYYAYIIAHDASIGGWLVRNLTLPPGFYSMLVGYGWMWPLSIVAVYQLFKQHKKVLPTQYAWLIVWFLSLPVLIYAPTTVGRRLILSFGVVIVLLSVLGLEHVWERYGKDFRKKYPQAFTAIATIVMLTGLLAPMVRLAINTTEVLRYATAAYAPAAYYDIMAYMNNVEEDAVILTPMRMGNALPGVAPRRMYVGHGHQTINFDQKVEITEQFYDTPWHEWKQQFVDQEGIDYVVIGHFLDFETPVSWELVYSNQDYGLYIP